MIFARAVIALVLASGLAVHYMLEADGRPWSLNPLKAGIYESLIAVAGGFVMALCLLSWVVNF